MRVADDIEVRLAAARTRLILEKPFIGALVTHLPLIAADADWCESTATDARAFYYNPRYIGGLDSAEIRFVLAHQALHCALGHFARRGHRIRRRWDAACDHAVNLLLIAEGMKPPAGALADAAFSGLSAEEIYPLLPSDTAGKPFDRHLFDDQAASRTAGISTRDAARGGVSDDVAAAARATTSAGDSWDDAGNELRRGCGVAPQPPAPNAEMRRRLAEQWRARVAGAAQRARLAGCAGESWQRLIDRSARPQLPWQALLARFMMNIARNDYSFRRPTRREGEALLPGLAGGETTVLVAVDTSGSIGDRELGVFVSEVDALKAQARARVTLVACDDKLDPGGPWEFAPWQPLTLPPKLAGGGGTSFTPVFDWIAQKNRRPDLLLYFTDADGEFPQAPPDFPVIWVVHGNREPPWGECIQLN
jgi:predicted metal-dependent peptidase